MTDEFNLSDKIEVDLGENTDEWISVDNVREFIRKQREEEIKLFNYIPYFEVNGWDRTKIADKIIEIRQKLAGRNLI